MRSFGGHRLSLVLQMTALTPSLSSGCFDSSIGSGSLQSGASSRAKHGGAYFSAIRGSIKDPIAVPGGHEVTGV